MLFNTDVVILKSQSPNCLLFLIIMCSEGGKFGIRNSTFLHHFVKKQRASLLCSGQEWWDTIPVYCPLLRGQPEQHDLVLFLELPQGSMALHHACFFMAQLSPQQIFESSQQHYKYHTPYICLSISWYLI